jgi:H/ACA ribonucleoprotein complex subunit 2
MRRICIIAGDISPIDVVTHLPVLCEEKNVLYIYVTSKEGKALACSASAYAH